MSKSRQIEKIVTIKRRPNTTNLPEELYSEGRFRISSTWAKGGKDIKRGITNSEEKMLMPQIMGVSIADPTFSKAAKTFFANLVIHIPADKGAEFNITTVKNPTYNPENGQPKTLPIHPVDYVHYMFCAADPAVAEDETSMKRNSLYKYYIEDLSQKKEEDVEALNLRRKATAEYLKLGADEVMMDWLLTMLGSATSDPIPVDQLDINDKDLLLDKFTKKHPQLFYELATDVDLKLKALIATALSRDYLDVQGDTYFYGDIKLGQGLDQAVRFIKDPANSKIYVGLRASMEQEGFVLETVDQQQAVQKKVKKIAEPVEAGDDIATEQRLQTVDIPKVNENDATGNANRSPAGT